MTTTIGIGVIGMGWMGEVHSRSYNTLPDRFHEAGIRPRLVVCADSVEARAQQAQERFGFARYTTNWRQVIDDPQVEVVDCAAPNGLHLEIIRAAAAAGKPILCEKPVGRFPEETVEAYHAASEAGILSFVGYNYRWAPLVQYARQLIEAGELGTLTHYHGRFLNGYAADPLGFLSWRFVQEQGLGALGDLLSHAIDMAFMLSGPIRRLVANRETFIKQRPIPQPGVGTHYDRATGGEPLGAVTNEDYVSALVRFGNGAQGILEACRVVNGAKCDMSFEVYGTRGALKWNMEKMNVLEFQRRNDARPAEEGYAELLSGPAHPYHKYFNPAWGCGLGYDDLKVIEVYNFLESVVENRQREPSLRAAYDVARVEQAIMRSWNSGSWEDVEQED